MHKAFPLPGESSHWQYKFPLPVEGVPTARRMEIPLPGVCTAMMKKLPNALEDEHHMSLHSPCESADESVYNFINIDDDKRKDSPLHLEPFVRLSKKPITGDKERVFSSESNVDGSSQRLNGPYPSQDLPTSGQNVEEGKSTRSAAIYVPNWAIPIGVVWILPCGFES
nr:hypothetical protein [Tanacetum cinerariifolium]